MNRLLTAVAEYPSILRRAGREGWLNALVTTHLTPCSVTEAKAILIMIPGPRCELRFRPGIGKASIKGKRYRLAFPPEAGTTFGQLRVGLAIHEAAHILDHRKQGHFGHGPTYCSVLRSLLNIAWRKVVMPTSSYCAIYLNHRGPFSIMIIRETTKKDKVLASSECVDGPFTAEEAHDEARMLVTDPRENVASAFIYSNSEQQHIGAVYKRGETYKTWEEEVGLYRMEQDTPQREVPLLSGRDEPVQGVGIEHSAAAAATPERTVPVVPAKTRKRGSALVVAKDGWPKSEAAQAVRGYFDQHSEATPTDIMAALGSKLNGMGVAHPASLISRLKQAGFLKEQTS